MGGAGPGGIVFGVGTGVGQGADARFRIRLARDPTLGVGQGGEQGMDAADGEGGYMAFDTESWGSVAIASSCDSEVSSAAPLDADSGTTSPSADVSEGNRARLGSRVRKVRKV